MVERIAHNGKSLTVRLLCTAIGKTCTTFGKLALVVGFTVSVTSLRAQVTYTFTGENGTQWGVAGNWKHGVNNDPGVPGSADAAKIPKNLTCELIGEVGDAYNVFLEGTTTPEDAAGVLKIQQGSVLKLHGTNAESTLNGTILMTAASPADADHPPIIEIQNDHVLRKNPGTGGATGIIQGDVRGILRGSDSTDDLTLGVENVFASIVVIRGDADIEVSLINHGVIDANHPTHQDPQPRITLKTHPKSGSGQWKATKGELMVDVGVSGPGEWEVGEEALIQINSSVSTETGGVIRAIRSGKIEVNAEISGPTAWQLGMESGDTTPEIEINTECTNLTGSFSMARGLFDVNADFCTSGQADIYRDSATYTTTIDVARPQTPVVLKFSGGCP
ncbi:MAG: hypothetical protein IT449_16710 [Phycisphaerales bacterium]|nr:hypothetical protein [Phycisphaerales bacterium]